MTESDDTELDDPRQNALNLNSTLTEEIELPPFPSQSLLPSQSSLPSVTLLTGLNLKNPSNDIDMLIKKNIWNQIPSKQFIVYKK